MRRSYEIWRGAHSYGRFIFIFDHGKASFGWNILSIKNFGNNRTCEHFLRNIDTPKVNSGIQHAQILFIGASTAADDQNAVILCDSSDGGAQLVQVALP